MLSSVQQRGSRGQHEHPLQSCTNRSATYIVYNAAATRRTTEERAFILKGLGC